jgi:hypothetical protein
VVAQPAVAVAAQPAAAAAAWAAEEKAQKKLMLKIFK